jgi:hypothetical protein
MVHENSEGGGGVGAQVGQEATARFYPTQSPRVLETLRLVQI